MPTISVIVPVYNVEPYIHRCVDSILNQTFTDFELILVDDGSPDNCGAICDEYAAKDNRITVIHKENGGLSDARNAGIDWAFANSDSEWLTFIDSDDWVHSKYLEALFCAAKKNNTYISICMYKICNRSFVFDDYYEDNVVLADVEDLFCKNIGCFTVACAKLYWKPLFEYFRYPIGIINEDTATTYKILFQFQNIPMIMSALYAYYKNDSGITGSCWSIKNLITIDIHEQQIDFFYSHKHFNALERVLSIELLNLAECLTKNLPEANIYDMNLEKELRKKLRYYLRKYKKWIHLDKKSWIYDVAYPLKEKIKSVFG